jgi:hypothetical protein
MSKKYQFEAFELFAQFRPPLYVWCRPVWVAARSRLVTRIVPSAGFARSEYGLARIAVSGALTPKTTASSLFEGQWPVMDRSTPIARVRRPLSEVVPERASWEIVWRDVLNKAVRLERADLLPPRISWVPVPKVRPDLFVVGSDGLAVPSYNGTSARYERDSHRKSRSETWCRALTRFELIPPWVWQDRSVRTESVDYGWKWVDRSGKAVSPQKAAAVRRVRPRAKYPKKVRVSGSVRVASDLPWSVVSEYDVSEIRRISRRMSHLRDIERKIHVAENEWEDVAQDALIRFALYLQESADWPVVRWDEYGRPAIFRFERKAQDDSDVLLWSEDEESPVRPDESDNTEDPDDPDTWGKRYYKVTRVSLWYRSVRAAMNRPKLGGRHSTPIQDELRKAEEAGHWVKTPPNRPEWMQTVYSVTEGTSQVDEDIFRITFQDGT